MASPVRQEIFIPIHGQVRLTESEITVLNHPAVQRLALIYQLGQTHLVYRGATHRRFEHILGTLHVVQLMIEAVNQAAAQMPPLTPDQGDWVLDEPLTTQEQAFTRLGALLHDLGHLPAGHTLEDELGLLPRHDSVERLTAVLDRTTWFGTAGRTLRALIDELYGDDAAESGLGKTPTETLLDLVASDRSISTETSLHGFRAKICRDLIGNTLCADILDYLHRDLHHLGKPRYFDTRLLEYTQIRRRLVAQESGSGGKQSEVVVNLRSRDSVRTDAVTLILDLLESRYQLHEMALFHRTKLSAAAMLERVVGELADVVAESKRDAWLSSLSEVLLEASDDQMLAVLDAKALELGQSGEPRASPQSIQAIRDLVHGLRVRRLHKRLHVMFAHQLGTDVQSIQDLYAPGPSGHMHAINRLRALRLLEADFGLPMGTLVMYCPPAKMATKIANVTVLVDGLAKSLDEFERDPYGAGSLTGGHLQAQKTRFQRLWRIHFAMREVQLEAAVGAGALGTLIRGIECLILGRRQGDTSLLDAARAVAIELTTLPSSPLNGAKIGTASVVARSHGSDVYPVGVPSLREFAT